MRIDKGTLAVLWKDDNGNSIKDSWDKAFIGNFESTYIFNLVRSSAGGSDSASSTQKVSRRPFCASYHTFTRLYLLHGSFCLFPLMHANKVIRKIPKDFIPEIEASKLSQCELEQRFTHWNALDMSLNEFDSF